MGLRGRTASAKGLTNYVALLSERPESAGAAEGSKGDRDEAGQVPQGPGEVRQYAAGHDVCILS